MKATISRLRAHGESGVGLIELLVAISVTGIIVPALGAAIWFGFNTTTDTQTRLVEANGARMLSSYFVPDVQESVTGTADPGISDCAGPVSLLLVTEGSLIDQMTTVSYYRGGPTSNTLYRRVCSGGAQASNGRVAQNVTDARFQCSGTSCREVGAVLDQADSKGAVPIQTTVAATRRTS
jgi:hypothetical protein